jgi:hypothetical protein
MEQEPKKENEDQHIDQAVTMLENPPAGDFIAGVRAFIAWVRDLVAKKD